MINDSVIFHSLPLACRSFYCVKLEFTVYHLRVLVRPTPVHGLPARRLMRGRIFHINAFHVIIMHLNGFL